MNHTYKVLKSDRELFAATLSQVRVYVVKPLSEDMVGVVDSLFAAPAAQRFFILHYMGECQRRCYQVRKNVKYSEYIWVDSTFGQQYAC